MKHAVHPHAAPGSWPRWTRFLWVGSGLGPLGRRVSPRLPCEGGIRRLRPQAASSQRPRRLAMDRVNKKYISNGSLECSSASRAAILDGVRIENKVAAWPAWQACCGPEAPPCLALGGGHEDARESRRKEAHRPRRRGVICTAPALLQGAAALCRWATPCAPHVSRTHSLAYSLAPSIARLLDHPKM